MDLIRRTALITLALMSGLVSAPGLADTLRIAVASNFMEPARELVRQFEQQSPHRVTLSFGSTGKLYAQISHGAPFTLFLSADRARPQLLEKQGVALQGSVFTYAYGRLALWSMDSAQDIEEGQILQSPDAFRYLAIANPRLAPYGRAAKEVLESRELWSSLQSRIVRGENIGQTFQFARSGNAQLGFVALSQILSLNSDKKGSYWLVPETQHAPIEQQAVLLKDNGAGNDFVEFMHSSEASNIIARYGYRVAGSKPDE